VGLCGNFPLGAQTELSWRELHPGGDEPIAIPVPGPRRGVAGVFDIDDSGDVDLSDAVFLFGFLFLGGAPPAPPLESCGSDPTPDDLACETFGGCS